MRRETLVAGTHHPIAISRLHKAVELSSRDTLYNGVHLVSSLQHSGPDAPTRTALCSNELMHVGVRLARWQIPLCCPNSEFRAIGGLLCVRTHTERPSTSVYRSRSRVDSEVNVDGGLVDARLKAAARRYRNTPRRRIESQSRRASKEPNIRRFERDSLSAL